MFIAISPPLVVILLSNQLFKHFVCLIFILLSDIQFNETVRYAFENTYLAFADINGINNILIAI